MTPLGNFHEIPKCMGAKCHTYNLPRVIFENNWMKQ